MADIDFRSAERRWRKEKTVEAAKNYIQEYLRAGLPPEQLYEEIRRFNEEFALDYEFIDLMNNITPIYPTGLGAITWPYAIDFPTEELFTALRLQKVAEHLTPELDPLIVTDIDIEQCYFLVIRHSGKKFRNRNNKIIRDELLNEIRQAIQDAIQLGTENQIISRTLHFLEDVLVMFRNFEYVYRTPDDEELIGRAYGIMRAKATPGTTRIFFYSDLVHIINAMLHGYGFDVHFTFDDTSDTATTIEFIRSHFYALGYYWDIFDIRRPTLDLDHIEHFDRRYFEERIKELEQSYKIQLT